MEKNTIQIQSILFNNRKEDLKKSLDSLANSVRVNKNSDIVVGRVKVCYGDASPERIFDDAEITSIQKEYNSYFDFEYTFFNENTGSAKGHNILGNKCISEYMIIMNPDVIVCPRFLYKIIFPFVNDAVGSVGMTEARQTPVEHPKNYDRITLETDWATTACAMFRTSDFKQLDGFDSKTFFLYCDDLDFSWRMRLLGKRILYIPDCVVFHAKTLSPDGSWKPTSSEVYFSAEAALLMAYKWSAKKKFNEIYNNFKKSNDAILLKAAQHFDELKINGDLPEQLDKDHKVAKFIGNFYTKHRFVL